jgi:hypothetical protein
MRNQTNNKYWFWSELQKTSKSKFSIKGIKKNNWKNFWKVKLGKSLDSINGS